MPLTPISEIIKNAAPNVRTIENGNETISSHNFCIDNNTNCTQKQALIASILPHGAENAVPAEDLCNIMGYSDTRQLRYEVAREREWGALILSTTGQGGGYFLPADGQQGQEEMQRFCAYRLSNIRAAMKSIQHIQAEIDKNENQMSLFSENQIYYE